MAACCLLVCIVTSLHEYAYTSIVAACCLLVCIVTRVTVCIHEYCCCLLLAGLYCYTSNGMHTRVLLLLVAYGSWRHTARAKRRPRGVCARSAALLTPLVD